MSERPSTERLEREAHVRWCVDILRSYGIEEHRCEQIAEALLDDGLVSTARLADQAAASERERAGWALYAELVDRESRQAGWTIADQAARLAAVEAVLAEPDDVQQWEDDTHECPDFLEVPIVTVARVRAALHPDPSETTP